MGADDLTIGELAQRTGTATSALRYYEELGLLTPAARVSGRRRYGLDAVDVVGVVLFLQEVGFSLGEIRELLASHSSSTHRWRELARRKVAELDERIEKAQVARVALQHGLRCQHEDVLDCPKFQAGVAQRLAGRPVAEAHPHAH